MPKVRFLELTLGEDFRDKGVALDEVCDQSHRRARNLLVKNFAHLSTHLSVIKPFRPHESTYIHVGKDGIELKPMLMRLEPLPRFPLRLRLGSSVHYHRLLIFWCLGVPRGLDCWVIPTICEAC